MKKIKQFMFLICLIMGFSSSFAFFEFETNNDTIITMNNLCLFNTQHKDSIALIKTNDVDKECEQIKQQMVKNDHSGLLRFYIENPEDFIKRFNEFLFYAKSNTKYMKEIIDKETFDCAISGILLLKYIINSN